MKAVCIKTDKWCGKRDKTSFGPAYMETVTVVCEWGIDFYILKEYDVNPENGIKVCYDKKWFIPLSSIDETEMERNYKTEKQTI